MKELKYFLFILFIIILFLIFNCDYQVYNPFTEGSTEKNSTKKNSSPNSAIKWYNLNYKYKRMITIQGSQVTATQSDFPVLITEANMDANFFQHVAKSTPSNIDIIFINANEDTELNREIVAFDSGNSRFEAWVKIPTLTNGSNTVIYMYYGNSSANRTNDTSTWSNGYAGLWHMQENSGTSQDSTSNSNSGTFAGGLPNAQNGKIYKDQSLNGTSDYIDCGQGTAGSLNINGNTPLTIECWVQFNTLSITVWQDFITKGDMQFNLQKGGWGDNKLQFMVYGTDLIYHCAISDVDAITGTWYHLVGRYNPANGNEVVLFVNSTKQITTSSSPDIRSSTYPFAIGYNSEKNGRYLDGQIDEVHIDNAARSDTWISTSYNNQNSPGTFYSVSGELVP